MRPMRGAGRSRAQATGRRQRHFRRAPACGRGLLHALAQQVEETLASASAARSARPGRNRSPSTISACRSAWLSMPSATAALPKRCARSIAVWQIAAIGGVGRAVLDEAAIELELDERQLAQARERRIAGAEIVDRDLDAADPQLVGDLARRA